MARSECLIPFVSKFSEPIISQEMILLRYELEDGSRGNIGIRSEALKSLHGALLKAIEERIPKEG